MGYHTEFYGELTFNKPVSKEFAEYINKFSNVRHMKRDVNKIKELYPNWKDLCYNGNLGENGEYFIGGKGFMGQDKDESVLEINYPPKSQPGLWCQWVIDFDKDGNAILGWDGGEKFYEYEEWLDYLIVNFFEPEGYVLNGAIEFQGEDSDDIGQIVVEDNDVRMEYGVHVFRMSDISDDDLIYELKRRGYVVDFKCS